MAASIIFTPFFGLKNMLIFYFTQSPLRYGLQISLAIHLLIILLASLDIINLFNPKPIPLPSDIDLISEADFQKIREEAKKNPPKKQSKKYDFSSALDAVKKIKKPEQAPAQNRLKEPFVKSDAKDKVKIFEELDNLVVKSDNNITLDDDALKKLEQKTQKALEESDLAETENLELATNEKIEHLLSKEEITLLKEQIFTCWNPPIGAKNLKSLVINVKLKLDSEGYLQSAKIIHALTAKKNNPFYRAAAESALRAVYHPDCTPLKLPQEKYEAWQETILTFNPTEILQ